MSRAQNLRGISQNEQQQLEGWYVLPGHLCQWGAISPPRVLHGVEVNFPCSSRIGAVLIIADLIDNEKQVDEVADCAKLFIPSVGIGMGHQEFVVALDEEGPLPVSEYIVAIDPGSGFCRGLPVVGIRGPLEGLREGKEIGEVKRCGRWVHDWKPEENEDGKFANMRGLFIRSHASHYSPFKPKCLWMSRQVEGARWTGTVPGGIAVSDRDLVSGWEPTNRPRRGQVDSEHRN